MNKDTILMEAELVGVQLPHSISINTQEQAAPLTALGMESQCFILSRSGAIY
jgi:hypothetical protein